MSTAASFHEKAAISTFISFRRIRYAEASLAFRDLMLSGLAPWLSDYCLPVESALQIRSDPSDLGKLIRAQITGSANSLALVDKGYFDSAWTRLEFQILLERRRPMAIVLLSDAHLPTDTQGALPSHCRIFLDLKSALTFLCQERGKELIPFAGARLCDVLPQSFSDLRYNAPSWFEVDLDNDRLLSKWGDTVAVRWGPVRAGRNVNDFDEVEEDLWRQVARLARSRATRPIGFHKLLVSELGATAVAVSVQCNRESGFCRYASLSAFEQKIEIAAFVKGNLQRFHTMIPDIDEVITSLRPANLRGDDISRVHTSTTDWTQALLWTKCKTCGDHTSFRELDSGRCATCNTTEVECLSTHCPTRRSMTFQALSKEAEREEQFADLGVTPQALHDPGLLCEGCLAGLFVPAGAIVQLTERPSQSMATVWSQRNAAFVMSLMICAYGAAFGSGFIHRIVFALVYSALIVEVFDRSNFSLKERGEPVPWFYLATYVALIVPSFGLGGGGAFFNGSLLRREGPFAPAEDFALAGALTFVAMTVYALARPIRFRQAHLTYNLFVGVIFASVLVWKLIARGLIAFDRPMLLSLAVTASTIAVGVMLLHAKRIIGEFDAARFWEARGLFR